MVAETSTRVPSRPQIDDQFNLRSLLAKKVSGLAPLGFCPRNKVLATKPMRQGRTKVSTNFTAARVWGAAVLCNCMNLRQLTRGGTPLATSRTKMPGSTPYPTTLNAENP